MKILKMVKFIIKHICIALKYVKQHKIFILNNENTKFINLC